MEDPPALQEQKGEDLEDSEKTPEQSLNDNNKLSTLLTTPGSESSSKRKGKHVMKKMKKNISAEEDEAEEDPAAPSSPSSPSRPRRISKLIIKPGKGTKGGRKKE